MGGGIFNAGQLTLMNVAVADDNEAAQALMEPLPSRAGGDAQGGGIYNAAGASLTITAGSNISGFARGGAGLHGVDGAAGADATAPSGNGGNGGDGTAGGNGGGAFGVPPSTTPEEPL